MPRSIETENITVAIPVDLLDLLDDICVRKDLHRTQTVVRAIKAYLALDAVTDCSLISILHDEYEKRQNEKIKK